MSAPFRVGDPAVWLEVDPEGMRVELTAVLRVRPDGDGWVIDTPLGAERVDEHGDGPRLVPLEHEMAVEFEERDTTSFVVPPTTADVELGRDMELFEQLDWRRLEQDLGPDHGPER
jgi:hypothetical protein